jgi:NAD(P)-dependent dehydrogenase (short-subunit alcohol dehydrogenase family)
MGLRQLAGRVAIVTGGSRGVGLSIAEALGAAGATVAIASRTPDELASACTKLQASGLQAMSRVADVTRSADVESLVGSVLERYGRIDVLVNNAGTYGAIGRLDECDPVEWQRAFDVNVFGTVNGCRAVLPQMRAQRSGVILNLAGAGVGGPLAAPRITAYAASKAAVVQLTESLAAEVAQDGIRVNAVAPGAVLTEMTAAMIAAGPDKGGVLYAAAVAQRASGGDPVEPVRKLAVWLASEASGGLTGKLISAKWDTIDAIEAASARPSLFSLRRIDGVLFAEARK